MVNPIRSKLGSTTYATSDKYKPTSDFKNECVSNPSLTILHSQFQQKLLSQSEERFKNDNPNAVSSHCFHHHHHHNHHHHHHHHNHSHRHNHGHHSHNKDFENDDGDDTKSNGNSFGSSSDHDFDFEDEDDDDYDNYGDNHNDFNGLSDPSSSSNSNSDNKCYSNGNGIKDENKLLNHCHSSNGSNESLMDLEDDESKSSSIARSLLKNKIPSQNTDNRMHEELWFNRKGFLNDGPACRCSINARKTGIRHGIFPGEEPLELCDPYSNNADKLYHYSVHIEPNQNFTSDYPTTIEHDNYLYKFEGFSLLSHVPLINLAPCKMIRFNIEYTIEIAPEEVPPNFTVNGLELFKRYLFQEILELYDLDWKASGDKEGCPRFHLYPRFARQVDANTKELLSVDVILEYLIKESNSLSEEVMLYGDDWQEYRRRYKDMIVWAPNYRPTAVRIDQIDIENQKPIIVHFGLRPPQLSYTGNPNYQRAWKELLKFRHLLANKPKVTYADKQTLLQKEEKLLEFKAKAELKRDTIVLPCDRFLTTGLLCDIVQHAMIMPVVVYQIRFQYSLECLENLIGHSFKDKYLLQLALTHPSYRENYGTNPDHARNTLNNLGFRQAVYGDNKINYQARKRGINTLFTIMSRPGCQEETASNIQHNERLEFLGDAVVEFLTSIHLYYLFPDLEEGGLATYRAALVQNQHLAILAKKLQLDKFMLYAHGSDLCHDLELRHAMANCFEALMAALFLDAGLEVADKVLSKVLFGEDEDLLRTWINYPKHPLQVQNPDGDRHLIESVPLLKKLTGFESMTGIEFKHIRILARAFTHRSIGYNNLTLGTNQRMEFLGDTVLQLIASEYLYKHFPGHHEGHLSLLRSSLVNNRTQTVVCDDLGMSEFLNHRTKGPLKTKDRADLLEAFIGALYVDGGLAKCRSFCSVCFFPRLEDFILHQSWNDPKSKLQQCCLTLRTLESREPDIPIYKVIDTIGPTNTRVYNVAVYFKDQRLATGSGPSIQDAEMSAATNALNQYRDQFPEFGNRRRGINARYEQSTLAPTNLQPIASTSNWRPTNSLDDQSYARYYHQSTSTYPLDNSASMNLEYQQMKRAKYE